jgi:hypothetical protein
MCSLRTICRIKAFFVVKTSSPVIIHLIRLLYIWLIVFNTQLTMPHENDDSDAWVESRVEVGAHILTNGLSTCASVMIKMKSYR